MLPPAGSRPILKSMDDVLHPRGFHGRWIVSGNHAHSTSLKQGHMVRSPGTSSFGGGPHIGNVQAVQVHGGKMYAHVRLHLDDSHPAMQDAMGDNPHMASDQIEMVDVVPVTRLEHLEGRYAGQKARHFKRELSLDERHQQGLAAMRNVQADPVTEAQRRAARAARGARTFGAPGSHVFEARSRPKGGGPITRHTVRADNATEAKRVAESKMPAGHEVYQVHQPALGIE